MSSTSSDPRTILGIVTTVRHRAIGVTTITLVVVLAGCATPSMAPDRTIATPLSAEKEALAVAKKSDLSDDSIERLVAADQPGCSAAVAVGGELVWASARGLADLANGVPLTTTTRFDLASISKQFTATAILMLQRDRLLSLADPVSQYVDGLPRWADQVTLDQLLHHTARIPDFWVELERAGVEFADVADQAATLDAIERESTREAGDGYFYSNSHYVLLAEVVARVSGQTLPEFLDERIFTPLNLDMVVAPGLQGPDIAISYEADFSLRPGGWTAYGHTGVITTPTDLVRWGDQYRTGDLVQNDFAIGAVDDGDGARYAAGITINDDGTLSHSGRWGGYISHFRVSADRDTVMAVACNGRGANRFGLADALWRLWAASPTQQTPAS